MSTPAERIIDKFGGPEAFQKRFQISATRIYRWTIPEDKGGTGGRVPSKHQQRILDAAREEGIDLSPADFFDVPAEGQAA